MHPKEKTKDVENSLRQAIQKLDKAGADFTEANAEYSMASQARTNALNKLNDAQKAFDAAETEFRASHAPRDTDWGQAERKIKPPR